MFLNHQYGEHTKQNTSYKEYPHLPSQNIHPTIKYAQRESMDLLLPNSHQCNVFILVR